MYGNMTSHPSNTSNATDYVYNSKTLAVVFLVIDPVIAIMTVFGNGLFIVTLIKKRSLHTPSNMLLGAMALCDLLVGIVAHTLWICELIFIVSEKDFTRLSTINYIGIWGFVFLSLICINVVSLDRYIAVRFANWYRAKATCRSHITIIASLLTASIIIYCLCQFIIFKANTWIPDYFFTGFLCLSVLVIGFYNLQIFIIIKSQQKQIRKVSVPTNNAQATRSGQDNSRNLVIPIITLLLFICYSPMVIVEVVFSMFEFFVISERDLIILQYWTEFSILLNSFINPIVYYARMKTFRVAARNIIWPVRSEVTVV